MFMLFGGDFKFSSKIVLPWLCFVVFAFFLAFIGVISLAALLILTICPSLALVFLFSPKVGLMVIVLIRTTLDAFAHKIVLSSFGNTSLNLQMILTVEIIAILSVLICVFLLTRKADFKNWSFLLAAGAFLLYCLISVFFSSDLYNALLAYFRYMTWILLMVSILIFVKTKADIDRFMVVGMMAAILPVLSALWDIGDGMNLESHYGINDIKGLYDNPPKLASVLFAVLPFSIFKAVQSLQVKSKRFGEWSSLFLLPAIFTGTLFTYYRAIWLSVIFSLVVTMLYYIKISKVYFIIFIVLLSLFVWQNMDNARVKMRDTPLQRIEKALHIPVKFTQVEHEVLDYGSGRLRIWSNIINAWLDAPIYIKVFGFGMSSSVEVSGRRNYEEISANAHNDFLELLINQGVLGLGLFFWLIYEILRPILVLLRRAKDPYYKCLAAVSLSLIFACFFPAMTSLLLQTMSVMFYVSIFLALTLVACNLSIRSYNGEDKAGECK